MGGNGNFRMSGTETLSATELVSWLDQLQAVIPGKVIVVYDACESGSFSTRLLYLRLASKETNCTHQHLLS